MAHRSFITASLLTACTLSLVSSLHADHPPIKFTPPPQDKGEPFPWFTGPLLTPSARTIPNGHANIEPYEFVNTQFGAYDSHWNSHDTPSNFYNVNTSVPMQIGLPANFDLYLNPAWSWNHTSGASHWVLNDFGFGFDYQLVNYNYSKGDWWPALKLNVQANAPIGTYQKLHPKSKGTDIGGSGSWAPSAGFVMSHLYWWGGHIFFAPRFNIQYTIPTPVHVKGYNAYGGGHHTHGTVFPGHILRLLFGFELALSQRWGLAGDVLYLHANKTRFQGHAGATAGVPNSVGGPSSESLSLAPAVEYNWSANYGVIAGVWFSVAGRNAPEFANAVIALNIYH